MKEPFISIIIPTYNEEKDIEKCLNSVFSLDYLNKEVIVVDGGSTDATVKILKKYCENKNFILIEEGQRYGIGAAYNKGAAKASGEVLIFLTADNMLDNEFLFKILNHYENGADFVVTNSKVVNDETAIPAFIEAVYTIEYKDKDEQLWSEGFSCKREAFFDVGGFPEFPPPLASEDGILGEKLSVKYKKVFDKNIFMKHLAPVNLKELITALKWRGTGTFAYQRYYQKKSIFNIILRKFNIKRILLLTFILICFIQPLLFIALIAGALSLIFYKAYLLTKTNQKYKKFLFSFFLLYLFYFGGIKLYSIYTLIRYLFGKIKIKYE